MRRLVAIGFLIAALAFLGVGQVERLRAASITETVAIGPSNRIDLGITPVSSTAIESSRVLCSAPCNLNTLTVTIGATSGWVMLLDAIAAPVDGAVAPIWWFPITSNGTSGGLAASWAPGQLLRPANNGLVAVFSTTGPFTKTASATAAFSAGVMP